jgi:two-component system chemotaxis response regulator CheY
MWNFANTGALEIVVIDASKFQLSLTRTMLSQIGVRRTRAYDNPLEALSDMMAEPSGLILVDADLPLNISCLRLIYGLRDPAIVPLCFTPIVVTVTDPTKTFVEEAIRHGANSVLAKPYSPMMLKQRIERVLADRDKLVLKDGRYVLAEILDTMEARALSSDPSLLAAILHSGGETPSPKAALKAMIDMLWLDEEVPVQRTDRYGRPLPWRGTGNRKPAISAIAI